MKHPTKKNHIAQLERLGFNVDTLRGSKYMRITCDSCAALVINGTATHEHGCPNSKHECAGCYEIVPARVKYCAECAL